MYQKIGFYLSALILLGSCSGTPSPPALANNNGANPTLQRFASSKKAPFKRNVNTLIQQFHSTLAKRAPQLIQRKYQAMAEAPFPFYRATAFLFYNDIRQVKALNSPVQVTLQGDFHLENMGTYPITRGGYAYDLNDFDEAFKGPYTWDLARVSTSIHLAAQEVGLSAKDSNKHVSFFLDRYLKHLNKTLKQPSLLASPLTAQFLTEKPSKELNKAKAFSRSAYLAELVRQGRFIPSAKIVPVSAQTKQGIQQAVSTYAVSRREGPAFFKVKDISARIAGKGSLGRYRYVVLIEGASVSPQDDRILEIKEAIVPSGYAFTGKKTRQNAQRIVQAYRYFLPQVDPLLGTTTIHGLDAFVRELLPKETVNLEKVNKNVEYTDFLESVALIAARAHARSGQGQAILSDAGSASKLIQRVGGFSSQYAQQVESDYRAFRSGS